MLRLDRIFYPVGQGGFYAERFYDDDENIFNAVYDCGSILPRYGKAPKFAKNIVENAFQESEKLDILFISHLDSDHVNLIYSLKAKIDTIIMPLLYDDEKEILLNIYECTYEESDLSIIRDLIQGEQIRINDNLVNVIRVRTNITDNPDSEGYRDVIDSGLNVLSMSSINTNNTLAKNLSEIWSYVPYNFKYKERHDKLINELKINNLDIENIKNAIKSKDENQIKKIRKTVSNIYKKLSGNINQNSMLLYSGINIHKMNGCLPRCEFKLYSYYHHEKCFCDECFYRHRYCYWHRCRCGALYTGDAEFEKTDFNISLDDYLDFIGVLQIPHHGARGNFSLDPIQELKGKGIICPVSYGKNTYGHPSKEVLGELVCNGFIPITITHEHQTKVIQHVHLYFCST
ncbi:hypothetical protein [Kingella oralis]|jgi:hypothetical protein|uniref:hypothetical protein n=1 Tax=Kingella oralis TaxID=505 RepID=UPI0034E4A7AB